MSIRALKRVVVVLGVLCAVLFVGSAFLLWNSGVLRLQVAFADDQTQILDEMRTQTLQSVSPPDIAGTLRYALEYCPSGTKRQEGSRLDRVVERLRTAIIRDIVAHLRHTTGLDLDENSEPWIQKYARN